MFPTVNARPKYVTLSASIPIETRDEVLEIAARMGFTGSQILRLMIDDFMKRGGLPPEADMLATRRAHRFRRAVVANETEESESEVA
jgi:antitoxin component of RelBE/YafQ-DinJ toxin-antitoxin module